MLSADEMYFAEFGQRGRPTLVLLHGLGMAHRMWQPQFEALAEYFHVLAPDLPGFARSTDAGPFTLPAAAGQIASLIREHAEGAAYLCGLSLGGMVAIQAALTAPETVAGLILSGAQVQPPALLMAFQQLLFAAMPEKLLLDSLVTDLPTRDQGLLSAAREDARQTGKAGLLQAMRTTARANFRPPLRLIQKPTFVLCGSKDWANLPAARELGASIPGAELRVISGAGHVWSMERPIEFTRTISEFVSSHQPAG